MNQEIEIEFKNLVTKAEFTNLLRAFNIHQADFTLQHNHYFDTPDFQIKQNGAALRIREKRDAYMLTLKQPHQKGLLETHQPLTEATKAQMLKDGTLPPGDIVTMLNKLGIRDKSLTYLGKLSTERAETAYHNGTLVFDHSLYLGKEDYEIEYEVENEQEGKANFLTLMQQHNIPVRATKNKIRRFFDESQTRTSEES